MTQAKIKLKNGNIIEISGPAEEIEKILALYPDPSGTIEVLEKDRVVHELNETHLSIKSQKALEWAQAQINRYVQQCTTLGCKFNYDQPGATSCKTANPRADD